MKSIFFPGGRNYKLTLIFSLALIVAAQASAEIVPVTEDFTDVTTDSLVFDTQGGIFHHTITELNFGGTSWDIGTFDTGIDDFDTNALLFTGAQDLITFDVEVGLQVESVSIELIDILGGVTYAKITGDAGFVESSNPEPIANVLFTLTTTRAVIGNLQYIVLYSNNGAFDNLTVNMEVPEPMTMSLLGLGGMMLRKRKRS